MAVAADYTSVAQELYLAYFGRPADVVGLSNMTAAMAAGDVPTDTADFVAAYSTNSTVKTLVDSFGNSHESQVLYGSGTTLAFVTAIYENLLNRDPLPEGLLFWANAIDSGTLTKGAAAMNILAAAVKDGGSAADLANVTNKVAVATNFTTTMANSTADIVAYAGPVAAQTARDMLHDVLGTTDLTTIQATIDSTLLNIVNGSVATTTLTLTANQDNGAAFTGGAANDVFNASLVFNPVFPAVQVQTLNNSDSLDGGAGTNTLNATLNGGTTTPTLKNIQNVNVTSVNGGSTLDLVNATGVTKVTITGSTAFGTVHNVGAADLAVTNQKEGAAFGGSTGSTINLKLDTVGAAAAVGNHITVDIAHNVGNVAGSLAVTANNANVDLQESSASANVLNATVAATGVNELNFSAADAATIKSLTVTGTGSVDFTTGAAMSALTSVTVGDGGVALVSTNAAAGVLTVTTGAGDDNLTVEGASVKSIDTGAGNDAVTTTGDATLNATANAAAAAQQAAQTVVNTDAAIVTADQATVAAKTAAIAADNTDITAKTAIVAADAANLATANIKLGTDNAALTSASAATAGIAAIVATDTTNQANAQTAATAADNASATADALVVTDGAALTAANDALAAAQIAATAAANAKTAADLVVTELGTAHAAINVAATQADNDLATATAVSQGALTDLQRATINQAFAANIGTSALAAQTAALAALAPIETTATNTATAAAATKVTADNIVTADLTAQANAQTALTNATTAAGIAATAKAIADAALVTATNTLNTDTTTLTAAQAAQAAAQALVDADNASIVALTGTQTADALALATAQALLVTDSAALDTANAALSAAQAALNTANGNLATAAAAAVAANAAAATAGALSATSTTALGAGDNTLTLSNGFAAGATISAGAGTKDAIVFNQADYLVDAAYSAANLAKVTGFEKLGFHDALTTNAYDVSKLAGIVSVSLQNGVATGQTATLTHVADNSTVTLAGNLVDNTGHLVLVTGADTAANVVNVVLNSNYADNNDTNVDQIARFENVDATGYETLNINSSGKMATIDTLVTGYKADLVTNNLTLADNNLVTLNVTGSQALNVNTQAGMTKLATIDASANTGGLTVNASAAAVTAAALTIKGSLTAANHLTGSHNADTIVGGAGNDVITGNSGGDTLTGQGGNDTFMFDNSSSVIGTGTFATITDFVANTVGLGASGAADANGANLAKLNGDVLFINANHATTGVLVGVQASAADATTFLANHSGSTQVVVSLDASTGNLYIDNQGADGVADLFIHLTGVSTINAAAIHLVDNLG